MRVVGDRDLLGQVFRGREHDPFGLHLIGDLGHPDRIADTDTGIEPGEVVDPDLALVPVLNEGPPDLCYGPAFPLDCYKITGGDLESEHSLGIQPGLPATLVAGIRGIHP